jgi:hypothetical protein
MMHKCEMHNICEGCAREYEEPAQQCDLCGLDGLCPRCIGDLDHTCEQGAERD